jgi:hypothetical protein
MDDQTRQSCAAAQKVDAKIVICRRQDTTSDFVGA